MKCGRNKSTAIIKDLASETSGNLAKRMKIGAFTMSTEGSNNIDSKQYSLVVRAADPDITMNSELLSIPIRQDSATGI